MIYLANIFKFKKLLPLTYYPAKNLILHQCFSVLFVNGKQFDPAIYDVWIQDFDNHDLHGKIS